METAATRRRKRLSAAEDNTEEEEEEEEADATVVNTDQLTEPKLKLTVNHCHRTGDIFISSEGHNMAFITANWNPLGEAFYR